jgi:HD-GYP domain-containing protein (c-di-GMP phosphodiesterase class II)
MDHDSNSPSVLSTLRARLRELGLPLWRCDLDGRVLGEPNENGTAGLWLRSRTVFNLVSGACAGWKNQRVPAPSELFPGCWAIAIPESFRRERTGYVIAMALGPTALNEQVFNEACASVHLEARAARTALGPMARYDSAGVRAIASMLLHMNDDLVRLVEDQSTIAGFTRQLTDGFETIDLLYSLGRSMNDLSQPRQFVEMVCQRIHGSMAFGWVAAWFGNDAKVARLASDDFALSGSPNIDMDYLRSMLPTLVAQCEQAGKALIVNDFDGIPLPGDTQVLVQPVTRAGKVIGLMFAGDKGGDDPQVSSYDLHLLEATGGYIGAFLDNAVLYADQQQLFIGTIRALTSSIDAKDRYTFGHSDRVAHLGQRLATALGLPSATCERVHICGLLHDVGKIGVPEAVLCKPGRLTDDEFEQIKLHPEIGHKILRDIPLLEDVLPGVLYHHERYDGKGYPHQLAGERIPLFARILALADTFDAMSSNRAYRPAMPREKVLSEIERCAGSQFDPKMAKAFVTLDFSEYDRLVALAGEQQKIVPGADQTRLAA